MYIDKLSELAKKAGGIKRHYHMSRSQKGDMSDCTNSIFHVSAPKSNGHSTIIVFTFRQILEFLQSYDTSTRGVFFRGMNILLISSKRIYWVVWKLRGESQTVLCLYFRILKMHSHVQHDQREWIQHVSGCGYLEIDKRTVLLVNSFPQWPVLL